MMDGLAISCHNFALSHEVTRHCAWIYDEVCTEVLPEGAPLPNPENRKKGEGRKTSTMTSILVTCVFWWNLVWLGFLMSGGRFLHGGYFLGQASYS